MDLSRRNFLATSGLLEEQDGEQGRKICMALSVMATPCAS